MPSPPRLDFFFFFYYNLSFAFVYIFFRWDLYVFSLLLNSHIVVMVWFVFLIPNPCPICISLPVLYIILHHTFHRFAFIIHESMAQLFPPNHKIFVIFLKRLPFNCVCRLEYLLICSAQTDAQLRLQYNETTAQWISSKYSKASIGELQSTGCPFTRRIMYVWRGRDSTV